jgi:hypothetical protein
MADPTIDEARRTGLVDQLMVARRAVRGARQAFDREAEADARRAVDEAKRALGERGPVWWVDGASDLNRQLGEEHALCRLVCEARSFRPGTTLNCPKPP